MHSWRARLMWAIPAAFAFATAAADGPSADTSDWKCTQCPFLQGYSGAVEAGVLGASGANAVFGRYTGIDHSGAYADAAASGQSRSEEGSYANYELERLGLASRDGYVEGGREGRYDLRVSYDGQPTRLYDTGATPFQANGSSLGLPPDWVPAGSTAGMSTLGAGLAPVKIESDRRTVALLARYFATPSWTMFGEFRRQEHDGTGLTSASFLTEAVQLAQPFDYVTNSFETGVAWSGRKASLRLSYLGSWFDDNNESINFANPYLPIVPGSTQGQLGVPPSNTLQQLAAAGNLQLPWYTTLTYTASLGSLKQNAAFLPVSTLPGSSVPTPDSLDGNVHLSHYALGLASRPLPKLSVRGNATYDGHDDKTPPLAIAYVVTDTFPGGAAVAPRYSEDRVRLDGGADYALAHWIKIGVGGKPGTGSNVDPKCGKLGARRNHAHRAFELHSKNRQWSAQGFILRRRRAAARGEPADPRVRLRTAGSGVLLTHRRVDRDVDADLVGGGFSCQGRLSIISPGSAERARAARVDYAYLDAARHLERFHRLRLPAAVQSAERVYGNRHGAVAHGGH
jgi:hypothetical protein